MRREGGQGPIQIFDASPRFSSLLSSSDMHQDILEMSGEREALLLLKRRNSAYYY